MAASSSTAVARKRRVCYFYHEDIGHYYYGPGHPMKPIRMKLTHHLLLAYQLYRKMEVYRPHAARLEEMTKFHTPDYVDFLQQISPEASKRQSATSMNKFSIGEYTDCPVFDGLYEYCQLYTGASLDAAVKLNNQQADVCVNWAGGLHHAKKAEASGFCYINDIVLSILELLKLHARVLYIDIDIHHGDGVEEAFYVTDRVMTVSFHKFGDFFPGTGDIKDVGTKAGRLSSLNFPLKAGIDDEAYAGIFQPIIRSVMEKYRPGAVVLQCGADSLTGDRLGCFNLTLKGHGDCVRFVQSFGLPMLVLGGGGYTIRNVSRCWSYETSILLGQEAEIELPSKIPYNDYYEYFKKGDYELQLTKSPAENLNTVKYLDDYRTRILENLRELEGAPGVAMHERPAEWSVVERERAERDAASDRKPDARIAAEAEEGKAAHEAEAYEGNKDQDGG